MYSTGSPAAAAHAAADRHSCAQSGADARERAGERRRDTRESGSRLRFAARRPAGHLQHFTAAQTAAQQLVEAAVHGVEAAA
jgi:7-keto-8-aminopelargonate synthetase-like enzyme